jgi:GAF domain-containing protein
VEAERSATLLGHREVIVAQIVTSARVWPSRAENAARRRVDADRGVRSRQFYLVASSVFAVVTYVAVMLIWAGGVALFAAAHPGAPAATNTATWIAHATGLVAWMSACLVVGLFAHQYQASLDSTLTAAHRRGEKLALVSEVSGTLSGPLPPAEIATKFLQKIKAICPDTTTAAVFMHDETAQTFKGMAALGPLEDELAAAGFPLSTLPETVSTSVLRGTPIVAYDLIVDPTSVRGREAWATFCNSLSAMQQARSFVLLPLMSRNRLIGLMMMRDDHAREVDVEPLQLLTVLTHFLAGALDNALSVADAETRAERAALISRVAQHSHASLDDAAVLTHTLEELGSAMGVGSVLVQLGKSVEDLRVAYEWGARGRSGRHWQPAPASGRGAGRARCVHGRRHGHPHRSPPGRSLPWPARRPLQERVRGRSSHPDQPRRRGAGRCALAAQCRFQPARVDG